MRGSASATATARVLLSTLNTVPERHGAVPLLNSGRHGLQQHPSRAGGDARRARGGAAAGRRSGWDPADAVHRLAGSARHPRVQRRGTEDSARCHKLPTASKEGRQIRLHRYQPTAGSQEMNVRTSWRKRSLVSHRMAPADVSTRHQGSRPRHLQVGYGDFFRCDSRLAIWSVIWPDQIS